MFLWASYQIWIEEDHSFLVVKDPSIDNFGYLDGEFGFFDKDLLCNFVMELGSAWRYFRMLELGILGEMPCSFTAYWHS